MQAFLAALRQPILYRPGVADLFSGDTGNHHDLSVLQETAVVSSGNRCTSLGSTTVSRSGPHRQGEQVEQGVEVGLLAQLLKADPVHLLQNCLQQSGRVGWSQLQVVVGRDHHHL